VLEVLEHQRLRADAAIDVRPRREVAEGGRAAPELLDGSWIWVVGRAPKLSLTGTACFSTYSGSALSGLPRGMSMVR